MIQFVILFCVTFFVLSVLISLRYLSAESLKVGPQRRGDKHRRIETCDQTEDNGQTEGTNGRNADRDQNDHNDKGRERRIDGSGHRAEDGLVDDIGYHVIGFALLVRFDVGTYFVEYNDGVVDGIRNDGDKCGNDAVTYFDVENNGQTHHDYQVVQQCYDGSERAVQVKTDNNVNEHTSKRYDYGNSSGLQEVFTRSVTDRGVVYRQDLADLAVIGLLSQLLFDLQVGLVHSLGVVGTGLKVDVLYDDGRFTALLVAGDGQVFFFQYILYDSFNDGKVLIVFFTVGVGVLEFDRQDGTTLEVDTDVCEILFAVGKLINHSANQHDENNKQRNDIEYLSVFMDVDLSEVREKRFDLIHVDTSLCFLGFILRNAIL